MTRIGTSLAGALQLYGQPRMLVLLLMGFSSGLPIVLIGGTLTIWLREAEVGRGAIGLFAYAFAPYTLKFLWAPFMDRMRLPLLGRLLGRRRSWMLVSQIGLMLAILNMAGVDPQADLGAVAMAALAVAFFSASQDIVVDAYRIELLPENALGAGAAVTSVGYRIGMYAAGGGALFLADQLGWNTTYTIMAMLVPIGMITALLAAEPAPDSPPISTARSAGALDWLRSAVLLPLEDFFARRGIATALAILAFISLYKACDVLLTLMAGVFYVDIGFSKSDIAEVSSTFGLFVTLLGGLAGGILVFRLGLLRALLVAGVLQALSNLMFAGLASVGPDKGFYYLTILVENLSSGMGNAAFIAYLSSLCSRSYTAVQYALLTSFMQMLGKYAIVPSSGFLADALGWVPFFVASAAVALPGLLILLWLERRQRADRVPAELAALEPRPGPAE